MLFFSVRCGKPILSPLHFVFIQVGVTYNVRNTPTDDSFVLFVNVKTADNNKVEARSCVKYAGDGENSGMAIMEFGLPSGFSLDQEDLNKVIVLLLFYCGAKIRYTPEKLTVHKVNVTYWRYFVLTYLFRFS
jgi:hypothetical protein